MSKVIFTFCLLVLAVWQVPTSEQSDDVFARLDELMAQGKFYDALLALQPLLKAKQRSKSQEEALWHANALCETLIMDGMLTEESEKDFIKKGMKSAEEYMQSEKIVFLNSLGADIGWSHLGWAYDYQYGFLCQLMQLYPNSKRHPSAEYYLIKSGFNAREDVERWLNELQSYVQKYADTGIRELYMAYLDIAHINDNLWQLLSFPNDYTELFSSGDLTLDKKRVSEYKVEALRYYSKVIASGYGGRFDYNRRSDTIRRFQDLKQNKRWNHFWILND